MQSICSSCASEGLEARYAQRRMGCRTLPPQARATERLDYELSVIEKMGFSDYFLIVWDFIRFAHEQGIRTGPGRGSSAGSLVAYVLRYYGCGSAQIQAVVRTVSEPGADIDAGYRYRLQR